MINSFIMRIGVIIVLCLMFVISSCEISDDGLRVTYEAIPIDSVQMPQTFTFGEQYDIPVYYDKPTSCHVFEGFNVDAMLNERTITVVNARLDAGDCLDENQQEVQFLRFTAASNGTYVFRFLTDQDVNLDGTGPDYLEFEVQVIE